MSKEIDPLWFTKDGIEKRHKETYMSRIELKVERRHGPSEMVHCGVDFTDADLANDKYMETVIKNALRALVGQMNRKLESGKQEGAE